MGDPEDLHSHDAGHIRLVNLGRVAGRHTGLRQGILVRCQDRPGNQGVREEEGTNRQMEVQTRQGTQDLDPASHKSLDTMSHRTACTQSGAEARMAWTGMKATAPTSDKSTVYVHRRGSRHLDRTARLEHPGRVDR